MAMRTDAILFDVNVFVNTPELSQGHKYNQKRSTTSAHLQDPPVNREGVFYE